MAAEEKWNSWAWKEHSAADQAGDKDSCMLLGQQLGEPGRFAYAALCGISLAWLFPEKEQSSFRMEFIEGLVKWLDLPDAVLPAMTAFASGLGGEGTETFAQILLKDPILKDNPIVITQDLVSFSLKDGYYDARARVLICHITWLLRIPLEELEALEESLLESLKEQKEEESEPDSPEESQQLLRLMHPVPFCMTGPEYVEIHLCRRGAGGYGILSGFSLTLNAENLSEVPRSFQSAAFSDACLQPDEPLAQLLTNYETKQARTAEVSRKKKERRKKLKRYLLIGLATVGGGTVIGLTGGLAAPLVAAGAATIIGSAGAAALGSTAGIAVMASLFGAAGAGLTGYKMKKRVGAIEEFEFLPLTEGKQLHITIAITGWLCTGRYGSFTAPWSSMLQSSEQYCLAWESKYLMELGNALDSLLNGFVNMMAQEALKFTVLSGIVTALTWPASLLTAASVIDNPWGVCLHRSAEVGKHLAHLLLSRQQGKRPVTLIGFSLGARVIYFCLQEMAQEKDSQGIIEDAVLLGAPVEGEAKHWKALTKVVSGRIINGYCRGDWLLGFVYRTSSVQLNVAGLQPVNLDDRRMVNVDLSSVVSGHLDYMKQMDTILKAVGIKTKECRLEEKGSASLFSPPAKKTQQAAGSEARQDEDAAGGGRWSWDPVDSPDTLDASRDGGRPCPGEPFPAGLAQGRPLGETSRPCPGSPNSEDGGKHTAGAGTD